MSDIYKTLRDIEDDKYEGWASAEQCGLAADEIERLRKRIARLEEALRRLITEVDNESPWRAWPDAKIRAFDVARIALEDQS